MTRRKKLGVLAAFALLASVALGAAQSAEARPHATRASYDAGQVLGGRPQGCPRRYCGCFASLELFGRIIPALNFAANWLRFPRAQPAPGHAAARRGHVFIIKQVLDNGRVLALDGNSGGGKTRLHVRSLHGFTVVAAQRGALAEASKKPNSSAHREAPARRSFTARNTGETWWQNRS